MRIEFKSGATPQEKIVAVNNKFGNNSIKDMQGTTRLIYDTILVPTGASAKTLRFFEDAAARTFPFTNCGSDGNKLGVGNSMVIQSISFYLLTLDTVNQRWSNVQLVTTVPAIQAAQLSFEIANNRVIKNLSLQEISASFDKNVGANNDATIELDTNIVIPPLLNYVCQLQIPTYTPASNTYIRCVINGAGGIIAPRTTF